MRGVGWDGYCGMLGNFLWDDSKGSFVSFPFLGFGSCVVSMTFGRFAGENRRTSL